MGFFEKLFGKSYSREAGKEYRKKLKDIDREDDGAEEKIPLEKSDYPAMLVAALITFGPAILIVAAILTGSLVLFGHLW